MPTPEPSSAAAAPAPRRTHLWRGLGVLLAGVLGTFVLMAHEGQAPHGPLWGLLTMLVAVVGLLDLLGLFELGRDDAQPLAMTALGGLEGEPPWASLKYAAPLAVATVLFGGILTGYAGLPWMLLLGLALLLPAAVRRPGLLVFVLVSAVYLPQLGAYGLWDPWETHYGEVAREILSRDDWISLWWAQENWFWSKPILIFWGEALAMGAMGVEYLPDANPAHPEWAVRLPIFLIALTALLSTYAAVAKVFSRRAGVVAALVLATMPYFLMLAHQAITDMPFVGNMTTAMAFLTMALAEDPERRVRVYRVGRLALSAQHAVIGLLVLFALPQALYLLSRNVTLLTDPFGFNWHADEFLYGSAGNNGIPGNAAHRIEHPVFPEAWLQPGAQALVWLLGLVAAVWLLRRERRARALQMCAFYMACAFAFMGKGIPGFALPGLVAFFYLIASRRWSLLFDGQLRVGAGALVIAIVGLPWYVAMYFRHGPAFTDRLLVHDHINRLAQGVHGDTGSIEYFLEQLGAGMFPWVALVPVAVGMFLWTRRVFDQRLAAFASPYRGGVGPVASPDEARAETLLLIAIWFVVAFVLFNAMITKFHHYIFPAVPPAGILTGIFLERAAGRPGPLRRSVAGWALAGGGAIVAVVAVAGLVGDLRGVIPSDVSPAASPDWVLDHKPWPRWLSHVLLVAAALLGLAAARQLGAAPAPLPRSRLVRRATWLVCVGLPLVALVGSPWTLAAALALCLAAVAYVARRAEGPVEDPFEPTATVGYALALIAFVFIGRDLSWVTDARPQGYERLVQLYIYNYGRPWPEYLDYRPIFLGASLVFGTLLALALVRVLRPVAVRAMVGLALAFGAWVVDIYMVDLSPHWGQRELVKAYYAARTGPEEPLVAWQMNWKGENFYSGNRVTAFVEIDNDKIKEWLDAHVGTRAFFLLEHGRVGNLKRSLGDREVREVTDKRLCNKFLLVEARI